MADRRGGTKFRPRHVFGGSRQVQVADLDPSLEALLVDQLAGDRAPAGLYSGLEADAMVSHFGQLSRDTDLFHATVFF